MSLQTDSNLSHVNSTNVYVFCKRTMGTNKTVQNNNLCNIILHETDKTTVVD